MEVSIRGIGSFSQRGAVGVFVVIWEDYKEKRTDFFIPLSNKVLVDTYNIITTIAFML